VERGVIVIGGGQAAARGAKAMRVAGYAGPITILGDEAHLPYERPMLSKAMLLQPGAEAPQVLAEPDYAASGITVRTGCRAAAIDRAQREVVLTDGARLRYDRLLIATGSRIRPLTIDGVAPERILSLRTLDDGRHLAEMLGGRPALTVVGGGFIGLEVAASAAKLGCAVTVIEAADRLLPRLGSPDASAVVLDHHRRTGVDVRLGVKAVSGEDGRLRLSDGSEAAADVVLAGVGVAPDTALAEAAGLDCQDGLLVDAFGCTSDPEIFAAGDVTRHHNPLLGRSLRLESWQNANVQAEAAGRTIAGVPTESAEIPWLWSDQGDLNLQASGAPLVVAHTVLRGDPRGEDGLTIFQFDGGRLVGGVTINRGKEMPMIRRLLAQPDLRLDPDRLADATTPLRRLLPASEAA